MLTINCLKFLTNLMMQFMNMIYGCPWVGLDWVWGGPTLNPIESGERKMDLQLNKYSGQSQWLGPLVEWVGFIR